LKDLERNLTGYQEKRDNMNVLEKILEEIEHEIMTNKEVGRKQCEGIARAMNIIRSHIDDVSNINVSNVAAINREMEDYLFEKYCIEGFDEELDKIFKKYLDLCKDTSIIINDGWISVEEKLPEKENERYYPMLNVATSYGAVKWGFYRVRDKEWYIYSEKHDEFIKAKDKEIVAWQPLPEPYKGGKENE
jgi:hypothetical protein